MLRFKRTKRVCPIKQAGIKHISYRNLDLLRQYVGPTHKIIPASRTGVCRKNQRALARAIKNARYMGLLPYVEKE